MKTPDFAEALSHFLGQHLSGQRNLSPNTIRAYRDTFVLLIDFCRTKRNIPPEKLTIDAVNADLIEAFLHHLEQTRNCSVSTRNQRFAALRSFFRFVQWRYPEKMAHCKTIFGMPMKRTRSPAVQYLQVEEIKALFAQPDSATPHGRRDTVLLLLLYDTGARVQELIDLRPCDLRLEPPGYVTLTGKGRKSRHVPLLPGTVKVLRAYLEEHRLEDAHNSQHPLFFSARKEKLTRQGVRYILLKYVQQAGSGVAASKVSPHTLRHSKAMHLLLAGNPAVIIQSILGHADLKTTMIYATADMGAKRKALESVAAGGSGNVPVPSWQRNASLLDWLKAL